MSCFLELGVFAISRLWGLWSVKALYFRVSGKQSKHSRLLIQALNNYHTILGVSFIISIV